MIKGLLASQEIEEDSYTTFLWQKNKTNRWKKISIFEPIKRHNIETGLKKKNKTPKHIDILKEDRQAFGILFGKVKTLEEALSHPLTTIPLV